MDEMNNNEMQEKKGGSKKLVKILIPVVAAVLILLLAVLNAEVIMNGVQKTFSSPEKYCQYVLKKNLANTSFVSNVYNNMIYSRMKQSGDSRITNEVAWKLSDDALDMIADQTGLDTDDISGLADISISCKSDSKGNQKAAEISFSAGKEQFLTAQLMFDGDKDALYVCVPELNSTFAKIQLDEMFDDDEIEEIGKVLEYSGSIAEILPDEKTVQKMYERYMNAAIAEIDQVEKDKEELQAGDIEQSVATLTIDIDEIMLTNIVYALCDMAIEDQELEDLIVKAADAAIELGTDGYYDDGEEVWDDFVDVLDEFCDETEYVLSDGSSYEMTLYVSGKGRIQGFHYVIKGDDRKVEDDFSAFYVKKGGRFACEVSYSYSKQNWFEITGEGKTTAGKLSGDFDIEVDGEKVSFSIDKLDIAGLKKGNLQGCFRMGMKQFKDVLEMAGLKELGLKELRNKELEISFVFGDKKNELSVALKEEKDIYAGISYSLKTEKAENIIIPSDSQCAIIEDDDALMEYMEDCDFEGLADTLYELYMPEDLVDLVSSGGEFGRYIDNSKYSADVQLADSIYTAVLTAMMDPEIVNSWDYNDAFEDMSNGIDLTECSRWDNSILGGAAEILGIKDDFYELKDMIKSSGATGRIWVTIESPHSLSVEIEGLSDRYGDPLIVR
ncbi:MAG: hypothetical protein IJ600_12945 [Lachnospiraceae bacterium]|nr:hypothetical protein [Lachnospiraceae bacterium]